MSHLHIPDGILPTIIWLPAWILSFLIIFLLIKKKGEKNIAEKVPLTALASAIMLLAMSIPLGILPFHLSLASFIAILLGPGLAYLAVFSVNFFLALLGHGGISLVALNSLIVGSEVLISSFLFRRGLKKLKLFPRTFFSVALALFFSVSFMLLIILIGLPSKGNLPFHLSPGQTSMLLFFIITGVLIEATASSFILTYLEKVRPDLLSK